MSVSIGDDVIDSRDIDERIEELRSDLDGTPFADGDYSAQELKTIYEETPFAWQKVVEYDTDYVEELIAFLEFKENGESATSEWSYGAMFINDTYFKEYAQDLADQIGVVDTNASWPANCIDWDQAADELKSDYTVMEVGGFTYLTRG
jgi:hypothetical protein